MSSTATKRDGSRLQKGKKLTSNVWIISTHLFTKSPKQKKEDHVLIIQESKIDKPKFWLIHFWSIADQNISGPKCLRYRFYRGQWCWRLKVGDNLWMLATEIVKNILYFSPGHFVSNIRHQHRWKFQLVITLSVTKPVRNLPLGRLHYDKKRKKKISSLFKAVHEKVCISGCHGPDTETIWDIEGIQNIKRTNEARVIRLNLEKGTHTVGQNVLNLGPVVGTKGLYVFKYSIWNTTQNFFTAMSFQFNKTQFLTFSVVYQCGS